MAMSWQTAKRENVLRTIGFVMLLPVLVWNNLSRL